MDKYMDLSEDLKILTFKFSKFLKFSFVMIYVIHKILVLIQNHLSNDNDSIFKYLLRTIIGF